MLFRSDRSSGRELGIIIVTMTLRRFDNSGAFPPFSSGMNFWIVANGGRWDRLT